MVCRLVGGINVDFALPAKLGLRQISQLQWIRALLAYCFEFMHARGQHQASLNIDERWQWACVFCTRLEACIDMCDPLGLMHALRSRHGSAHSSFGYMLATSGSLALVLAYVLMPLLQLGQKQLAHAPLCYSTSMLWRSQKAHKHR